MQRIRQEKTEKPTSSSTAPVVIIGAGASGLVAANILRRNGVDVVIVEAQNYPGGRVKQLKGWVDWKDLDLGAEFVHGEKSILKTLIDKNGWPCRLLFTWAQGDGETPEHPVGGGISLYFMGREKRLLRYDTEDPEIQKVNSLLWDLYAMKPAPGDNRTLEQYLLDNGVTPRVLALADAGYANTLCSSMNKLSLDGVCTLESKWDNYGGGDYRLDGGLYQVIERLSVDQDIRLEWPVKSINYEKDNIIVTSSSGQSIEASRVLVTVPLPVLKDEDIEFNPPLPAEKVKSIKTIGMDNAIKIVMKFSRKFWPSEVHGVICADTFLPELWFEEPSRVGVLTPQSRPVPNKPAQTTTVTNNKITVITTVTTINNSTGETKTNASVSTQPATTFTVAGFACSRIADRVSKMSKEEVISSMLAQLDTMFAKKSAYQLLANSVAEEEGIDWNQPATSCFLECLIHDWGKVPFVKGGYSSPTVGATRQMREDLNRAIGDKVFFAGEATNPESFMTLHGAMETGEMAANAILKAITPAKSAKIKAKL